MYILSLKIKFKSHPNAFRIVILLNHVQIDLQFWINFPKSVTFSTAMQHLDDENLSDVDWADTSELDKILLRYNSAGRLNTNVRAHYIDKYLYMCITLRSYN